MKILVIDDEKPTLSMFRLFLTAYGYEVHTAEDGEKGLALFHEIKPGIVFTDIKMPGLDGLEDMENAVEALDLDASDFINKPVERHALSSALARAEKRRQMQKDLVFEFFETEKENHHIVSLQGKLSASARPLFSSLFKTLKSGNEKEVILIFNDGFSIDKSGISLLMEVIQKLKQKNISIVMENLSYNYLRIFQMAGMDKFATMKEALAED